MKIHRLEKKNQYYICQKQLTFFFKLKSKLVRTNQKISMYPISDQKILILGNDQKSGNINAYYNHKPDNIDGDNIGRSVTNSSTTNNKNSYLKTANLIRNFSEIFNKFEKIFGILSCKVLRVFFFKRKNVKKNLNHNIKKKMEKIQ